MRKSIVVAALAAGAIAGATAPADAEVILTNASHGFYNNSLGTLLDFSDGFPCADGICGDPVLAAAPAPDLTAAEAILGDWLGNPASLNANWSGLQPIPSTWAINEEAAVVYAFSTPIPIQLTGSFGVDNGIYVWLDGIYRFGAMQPYGAYADEYPDIDLGIIGPGTHYLQILLEDHGVATGYHISVTATDLARRAAAPVPEPGIMLMLLCGASAVAARHRRRCRQPR